jgi:hypothetical protein
MFTPDGNDWRDRSEVWTQARPIRPESPLRWFGISSLSIDIATAWASLTKWLQGRRNYFVFNCCR